MKINPLFKWFGSKWMGAKYLPTPIHKTIIEPFAGGAGYSLNYSNRQVVIYDNDPNLKVLWPWLINEASEEEIMSLPAGEELSLENVGEAFDIRDMNISQGAKYLIKSWQRTNSVGNCWTISPWGHKPGQWTISTRNRVAKQVKYIKHWLFVEKPEQYEIKNSTIYFDPPYINNYRYATGKFFNYNQFVSVVEYLSQPNLNNQVIVSEGPGATYLPFRPSHEGPTMRRRESAKELIWSNI